MILAKHDGSGDGGKVQEPGNCEESHPALRETSFRFRRGTRSFLQKPLLNRLTGGSANRWLLADHYPATARAPTAGARPPLCASAPARAEPRCVAANGGWIQPLPFHPPHHRIE